MKDLEIIASLALIVSVFLAGCQITSPNIPQETFVQDTTGNIVEFPEWGEFTDISEGNFRSPSYFIARDIAYMFLNELESAGHTKIRIIIEDIDLAGEFMSSRTGFETYRMVSPTYPARIRLTVFVGQRTRTITLRSAEIIRNRSARYTQFPWELDMVRQWVLEFDKQK